MNEHIGSKQENLVSFTMKYVSLMQIGRIAAGYITLTNGPRRRHVEYVMKISLMDHFSISK